MDTEVRTMPEVAALLDVREEAVRQWLEAGRLRGVRAPAGWRITEADLEAFLQRERSRTDIEE